MISKSDYIKCLQCRRYLWLHKYRKDLYPEIGAAQQAVFDEGYAVEDYAYDLFPGGADASADDFGEALRLTRRLMKEKEIIYQPSISDGELFCRADIIKRSTDGVHWDIYEVKSATSIKESHLNDLAFQKLCFEKCGALISRLYLICVNNQYVRHGEIDAKELLLVNDVTEEVLALSKITSDGVFVARQTLLERSEPELRILNQCHSPYDCPFIDHCWRDIPDESIYELAGGLSDEEIAKLQDEGVEIIADIPDSFAFSVRGRRHWEAVKHQSVNIDKEAIVEELSALQYPIYFLDYETNSPAIPLYDGYRPYQRMVFQYSLHVLRAPDSELEHYEYLCDKMEEPAHGLLESLSANIGDSGSVVVWYKAFEMSCNKEMAELRPEYATFLNSVNERVFDLMEIFRSGLYVHYGFRGSSSIKKVLPVLVPDLSYQKLNIQEGATASDSWLRMVDGRMDAERAKQTYQDLLRYCELDTLAMVKILESLRAASGR